MRRPHSRVGLAALAIAAIAVVTVMVVTEHSTEETVLEATNAPGGASPQAKAPVETHFVKGKGYKSFDRASTGSFSRRRTQLGAQDATGQQFDKMFSKYFDNPNVDLEDKLKAAQAEAEAAKPNPTVVGTMGAPVKKTVEVIKELAPVHVLPKPDTQKPPEVEVVNGKDYTVKKVIHVTKTLPGKVVQPQPVAPPPAVPAAVPAGEECATCVASFKLSGGCAKLAAGADISTLTPPGCAACEDQAVEVCDSLLTAKTAPPAVVKPKPPPADDAAEAIDEAKAAADKAVKKETEDAQAGSAEEAAPVQKAAIKEPPQKVVAQAHTATTVGEPVILPPIDIHSGEPLVNGHKITAVPPSVKPPVTVVAKPAPVEEDKEEEEKEEADEEKDEEEKAEVKVSAEDEADEAIDKAKAAANKAVKHETEDAQTGAAEEAAPNKAIVEADDGVFGTKLVPKAGAWTGGNSNYGRSDQPWKPTGNTWPPSTLEQVNSDDVAPWDPDAEVAPWMRPEEPNKDGKTELLQMAAHACAARKLEQAKSCKKAEATAAKDCETDEQAVCDHKHEFARKFCDRTAKVAMQKCFKDWQVAKAAH